MTGRADEPTAAPSRHRPRAGRDARQGRRHAEQDRLEPRSGSPAPSSPSPGPAASAADERAGDRRRGARAGTGACAWRASRRAGRDGPADRHRDGTGCRHRQPHDRGSPLDTAVTARAARGRAPHRPPRACPPNRRPAPHSTERRAEATATTSEIAPRAMYRYGSGVGRAEPRRTRVLTPTSPSAAAGLQRRRIARRPSATMPASPSRARPRAADRAATSTLPLRHDPTAFRPIRAMMHRDSWLGMAGRQRGRRGSGVDGRSPDGRH